MKRGTWTLLPVVAAFVLLVASCDGADDGTGSDGPGADTATPAEDTTEPTEDTMDPGEDTIEPGDDVVEPAEDAVEPPEDTHDGPCPPMGPFGTEEGDIIKDAVLIDCDGVEHSVHGLCDTKVTWIFSFSGW